MPSSLLRLGLALLAPVSLLLCAAHAQAPSPLAGAVQQLLVAPERPYIHPGDGAQTLDSLRALYARHGFAPLWERTGRPTAQALRLVEAFRNAAAYGLRPADYDAEPIAARMSELATVHDAASAGWAELDLRLSGAALRFVSHLHFGRVDPRAVGFRLSTPRATFDATAAVDRLVTTSDTAKAIAAVEPPFHHYELLKAALAKYRGLAADHDLTPLPGFAGRSVKPGAVYAGAPVLRRLLVAVGDLGANATAPASGPDDKLDPTLVAGLESFQVRHGLAADGVLGRRTLAALNVPMVKHVRQIELTLERWRWLPPFDTPPIIVNIPQFRLFAFGTTEDRESDVLRMNVIVGQAFPHTRTPIFLADMKYVIFRPFWDVPDSIVQRELLAPIRAQPDYLEKNHMELVRGESDDSPVVPATPESIEELAAGKLRLRQRPGDDNALGAIKFVFPNPYNVFLHGTPAQRLFKEPRRAYSHGCIRVSDPVALAEYVLRNAPGEWSRENIEAAMSGEPNQRVTLSRPIRVMVLYGTAFATESGRVLFLDDIYGHDRRLERLLDSQPR
jgi:murein L,D-transpeptidase YcbB/YkuD